MRCNSVRGHCCEKPRTTPRRKQKSRLIVAVVVSLENAGLMLNGHAHKICSVCAVNLYLHNVASFYAFMEDFEIFLRQRRSVWQLATDEVQSSVLCTRALSLSLCTHTHTHTHNTHKTNSRPLELISINVYCISGLGNGQWRFGGWRFRSWVVGVKSRSQVRKRGD